jgi:hypothetical protein
MKYIDNLRKNNIDIDILYDKNYKYDNYLSILLKFKEEPKSIAFLLEKNEDDCNSLKEAAGDDDNALINIQDIDDFRKCIIFMKQLGYKPKMKEDDFLSEFQKYVKKSKDIQLYFTRYVNLYNDLNKLFQKKFDKSAASKQKIISICENSDFTLINKKHNFFRGYYLDKLKKEEENEKSERIRIKIPALKELRDRVLFTKKVPNNEEESKNTKKFDILKDNVSAIFKIYDLIKEIYSCGYINEIKIIITLRNYEINFKVCDLDTSNSEEVTNFLKNIITDFKKAQLIAYRDIPLTRYIYGRQINLIYDKIYKNKDNAILPLLKFITNNSLIEDYIIIIK